MRPLANIRVIGRWYVVPRAPWIWIARCSAVARFRSSVTVARSQAFAMPVMNMPGIRVFTRTAGPGEWKSFSLTSVRLS